MSNLSRGRSKQGGWFPQLCEPEEACADLRAMARSCGVAQVSAWPHMVSEAGGRRSCRRRPRGRRLQPEQLLGQSLNRFCATASPGLPEMRPRLWRSLAKTFRRCPPRPRPQSNAPAQERFRYRGSLFRTVP